MNFDFSRISVIYRCTLRQPFKAVTFAELVAKSLPCFVIHVMSCHFHVCPHLIIYTFMIIIVDIPLSLT